MSHEIRNPMNGIIGMMHVLLDSDLTEEQQNNSKIVYNSTRALLSIVNDILLVEKMGGKIGAESIEMVGSTFWFDLPLEKQMGG